jgi:flagellar basal body P-ring protein FlgI
MKNIIDFIKQNCKCDIDFEYHLNNQDFTTVDEIEEILNDNNAFDQEVIYYSRAIDLLKEHDNSLRRSLEIASDLGYETKNLNSEILASLLATELCREEWADFRSELEDYIDSLEDDNN